MTQEAMKLALEALTYLYTETTADEDELIDQAITAIKEALAQTERSAPCAKHCEATAFQITIKNLEAQLAQRKWVGLTDEEFQLIYDMGRTPAGMMEMVEAKLKEKNHG